MRQETDRRPDHVDRRPGRARGGWLLRPPTLAGTAVALLFWWWSLASLWPGWQNQQRALVGMEPVPASALGPMVALTLVLFGLLLVVGRLVGHGIALFDRLLARRLPRMAAHAITAAVFAVAAVVVTRDAIVDGFLDWANRSFVAGAATPAELRAFHGPAAESSSRSGSTPGCGRPPRPTRGPRWRCGSWSGPAPSPGSSWA